MSKPSFHQFLSGYLENLILEEKLASGQIDTEEKFNDFKAALRQFGFAFTVRSSRSENYNIEDDQTQKKKLPGRGSLMYKSNSDVPVPFFGYPFIVETTIYYTCAQGIKYYGSKRYPDEMFIEGDPLSKKRRRPKVTQKIGCQAKMTVKKIKVFNHENYLVGRDNWREKKAAIDNLRTHLQEDRKVDYFTRYCIVISLDTAHNHLPSQKLCTRPKKNYFDPARKVIKLHEQIQEALVLLNSDLIGKCTNITTLNSCCAGLKSLINQLKESIEKNDGVPDELITLAMEKISRKNGSPNVPKLQCCTNAERRAARDKRKQPMTDLECDLKVEMEDLASDDQRSDVLASENTHIIELPGVLDGAQVIWDPVNVSWIPDGQGLVIQSTTDSGGTSNRGVKQSIVLQRRMDESPANLGVISQGGQNFIVQHSSLPNIGVSMPFTMAKVVQPSSVSPNTAKKTGKRNDVGVAIAIPAGVDWNQSLCPQMVVSGDQFQNFQGQTVWNIT